MSYFKSNFYLTEKEEVDDEIEKENDINYYTKHNGVDIKDYFNY